LEGGYITNEVNLNTGELLLPAKNAKKFVNRCGVLVRGKLSISTREWKQKKDDHTISFVFERDKDLLWLSVTTHFQLPGDDDVKELVKCWALKKMATQF
jgi:hypothetical protein